MKYVDFIAQTIGISAAVTIAIVLIFDMRVEPYFYLIQLFVGAWQLIGCIIFRRTEVQFKMYLKLAGLCLLLLASSHWFFDSFSGEWASPASILFLVVPCWALAFFYYVLTITLTFPRGKSSGRFLPHVGF